MYFNYAGVVILMVYENVLAEKINLAYRIFCSHFIKGMHDQNFYLQVFQNFATNFILFMMIFSFLYH